MIIGVAGKLESGKDTYSDYLAAHHGYTKLAFADNLKKMCMKVFNLTHEDCYSTHGKFKDFKIPMGFSYFHALNIGRWLDEVNNWPITYDILVAIAKKTDVHFTNPRHVLQFVGTEVMRDCVDPDIHAKIIMQQINREALQKVVISDARFENERKIVKEHHGKLVLVDCVQTRDQESAHRSETGLGDPSEYDLVVVNDKNSGIPAFYERIEQSISTIQ